MRGALPHPLKTRSLAAWRSRCAAVVTIGTIGITPACVALLPALEIIAVNGIGIDAVAFEATRPRGILVTNTPGVLTDDVADLALTLLLAQARRLPALDRYVRAGARGYPPQHRRRRHGGAGARGHAGQCRARFAHR